MTNSTHCIERGRNLGAATMLALLVYAVPWTGVKAYERPGQLPVLIPEPIENVDTTVVTEDFAEIYQAAGRPRIVLFWDVAFDQHTEMEGGGLEHSYDANFGTEYFSSRARLGPASQIDPSEQFSGMSIGNTAAIESAFVATLLEAGIGLVDRGTVMRSLHASEARTERNRKLIETDAVQEFADLLLEVLTTWDEDAPLGFGFRVSCRDLSTGKNMLGLYYTGTPTVTQARGGYLATNRGFKWYQPVADEPEVGDFGRALAETVLAQLGPRIRTESR